MVKSLRGKDVIEIDGYLYFQRGRYTWWCPKSRDMNCKAKIKFDKSNCISTFDDNHCHPVKKLVFKTATGRFKRKPAPVAKAVVKPPWSKAKTTKKRGKAAKSKAKAAPDAD